MPVPDKVFLSTPSDTYTSAIGAIGEVREYIHPTLGKQMYRMVKNSTGSSIAANLAVSFSSSGTSGSSETVVLSGDADPSVKVAGITQNAIPDGHYGWVVCAGQCTATADAAVDISTLDTVITKSAGEVDDTAISGKEHCIIGVFMADVAGAGTCTIRLQGLL
tara:strand:- start:9451 stop:9939 length:489 start_codon:yes stop_codon:yes gene_type:complete